MPKRNNEKNIGSTELDKLLSGRDESGKFIKRITQIEKMRAVIEKLSKAQAKATKQIMKSSKSVMASLKRENVLLKGKSKLQGVISKSALDQVKIISKAAKVREKQLKRETRLVQKNFKTQMRLESKLNRTRERLSRKNRSSGGGFGGLGIGRIGLGLGSLGLGFAAVRQLQQIAGSRRSLAVSGGLSSLRNVKQFTGKDIATTSGASLVDQFLQQGISQLSIGRSPIISKGLLNLQESLSGVGTEIANRIILDLSANFSDPKRLKGFFGSIGGGQDIEQTLRNFQSQGNVTSTLRALNALEVSQAPSTGDSILDGQRELSKATEKLKAEFENLAGTLANDLVPILKQLIPELKKAFEFLGGLSTKDVAIGVGALALAPSLLRGGAGLAGKGLVRGGAGLASRLIPSAVGLSEVGVASAATLALPLLIGGGIASNELSKTKKSLSASLSATQSQSLGLRRLGELADNESNPLKAKKLRIERQIAGIFPAKTESNFVLGPQLTGEFSPQQDKQLLKLNDQRSAIISEIKSLESRTIAESKVVESTRKQIKSVEDSSKAIDKFSQKIKKVPESKIENDISQLFTRANLQIDALESQSNTALRRSELEIAKISPFGILGAGPEANKLLSQLQSQEGVLRQILDTMDTSTREGRTQANNLLLQVSGLKREEKELRRSLVTAFLDQALSQAAGAGRFSKILITAENNAGIGLRKNVLNLPTQIRKQLSGSVDPNLPKKSSRTSLEILGKLRSKNLIGSNSGQSMVNIGTEMKKLGQQMQQESQVLDNKMNDDDSFYRLGRTNLVQPN